MMKKVLLIIMSVLLLSGCFMIPAAAEHEIDPNATMHSETEPNGYADMTQALRDYIDQNKKELEARMHYAEEQRELAEYIAEYYQLEGLPKNINSVILDRSWEMYQCGKISEKQYWQMYNFIMNGKAELYYYAFEDPDNPKYSDLTKKYYTIKNNKSGNYTKEDATILLLFEGIFGLNFTDAAYNTLLNPQTHSIEIDKEAAAEVINELVSIMTKSPYENDDISEVERQEVLADGGRTFVSDLLNDRINRMYEVLYPFGIIIMLVCWMIGMTKSGLNATFDIKDKDSIARSMIDLVIGIGLLALTPWLIEVMTSLGFDLCDKVGIAWRPEIYDKDDSGGVVRWVIEALGIDTFKDELILVFIKGTLVLNIMRMALMQCLAPLSIGCIAGGDRTKNMSFGWLKEYLKLCLLPGVTAVYICIACAATHTIDNMWINIAIGFSFFLVPKMTMDKLFG